MMYWCERDETRSPPCFLQTSHFTLATSLELFHHSRIIVVLCNRYEVEIGKAVII